MPGGFSARTFNSSVDFWTFGVFANYPSRTHPVFRIDIPLQDVTILTDHNIHARLEILTSLVKRCSEISLGQNP